MLLGITRLITGKYRRSRHTSSSRGRKYTRYKSNRAFIVPSCLKFGTVLGMGVKVSKTIANKLWSISIGHFA